MIDQLCTLARRVLYVVAFVVAGLALWEKLANLAGRTLTFLGGYSPSRLLEWAAVALLFVIALELRQMRHFGTGGGRAA